VDGLKDLQPPATDPTHMAGNHVLLQCDSVWVLLGHLQRGSVRTSAGQQVRAGQMLGQVGNTGNTDEPHLHIHAQRPGSPDAPLSGAPLPISFGGRFPARNSRIRSPADAPRRATRSVPEDPLRRIVQVVELSVARGVQEHRRERRA
jgi:murein DD-endopeptidase MepM/ murein hydrolase activator NlpD